MCVTFSKQLYNVKTRTYLVIVRATLQCGKYRIIDRLAQWLLIKDHPGAWAAQRFVCGGGHHMSVWKRVEGISGGNKTSNVCHVNHQIRTDSVANLPHTCIVPVARVSTRTCNDELGFKFRCQRGELVVINQSCGWINFVWP